MESPTREIFLNRNKVKIGWEGKNLTVVLNDSDVLYVHDLHTILRCVNEVRRETWELAQNLKNDGLSCTHKIKKKPKLVKV